MSRNARATLALLFGLLVGLSLTSAAMDAVASESLRVRVQRPLEDDALIDEAVNRVIGELQALGYDVEVLRRRTRPVDLDVPGQLDPGTEAALVFARDSDAVLVSVWVKSGPQAFVQKFPEHEPRTTAEVIAVSAVEALRGVLIQPKREAEAVANQDPAPEPVLEPARVEPPFVEPEPPDPPALSSDTRLFATTFLAPTVGIDAGLVPNLGAAGSVLLGVDNFAIGVSAERLFYAARVTDEAGDARIERQYVAGVLHGHLDLAERWEAFAEFRAGVASYAVRANANPGFTSAERAHSDLAIAAGAGFAHWAFPNFGWFMRAEALVLPKPIRILMEDRAVATLGSPAATLAVGIAARVR